MEAVAPGPDLFIYYLEGRIADPSPLRGPEFLGNWEEDGFSFLFFSGPADDRVRALVSAESGLSLIDRYDMPYDQWQGDGVGAFGAGKLFVAPPGSQAATPPGMRRIVLDPGVVFGTGAHPTTRECLWAIQEICAEDRIGRVLDLGAGTGVLALAAAALGCGPVLAVDFNRLAAETTRRNILRNGMADRVLAVHGRAETLVGAEVDLLAANLHHDAMMRLIAAEGFLRARWFVLSGLFRSQAREVSDALERMPVRILDRRSGDGIWHTLVGRLDERRRPGSRSPRREPRARFDSDSKITSSCPR